MKQFPINAKNLSVAADLPYRLTPTFMLRASLNLLFLLIFMSFLLLTPAYSAGSDSSDDKPAKPAHSKEYYKAVKLIKAGSFDEALVILETIIQKNLMMQIFTITWGFLFVKRVCWRRVPIIMNRL